MKNRIIVEHSTYGSYNLTDFSMQNVGISHEKTGNLFDLPTKAGGDLLIFGSDFDKIITHNKKLINFIYYENGKIIGSGTIDLFFGRDINNKKLRCQLKIDNKYAKFDKFSDTKYNIVQVPRRFDLYVPGYYLRMYWEQKYDIEYYGLTQSVDYISPQLAVDYVNNGLQSMLSNAIITDMQPDQSWGINNVVEYKTTGLNTYYARVYWARASGFGFYDGGVAQPPNNGTWYFQSDVIINGVTVPKFAQPIDMTNFEYIIDGFSYYWNNLIKKKYLFES